MGVLSLVRPEGPESSRAQAEIGIDRERAARRGGVDVPGRDRWPGPRRCAGRRGGPRACGWSAPEQAPKEAESKAALEARARLVRGEAERRGVVVGEARGAGVNRAHRRGRVDRERASGRGGVGVAGRVGGADLEGVGAVGEGRGRMAGRARAGAEGGAVRSALVAGAELVGAEAKCRRVVVGEAGGPGVERRFRGAGRPRVDVQGRVPNHVDAAGVGDHGDGVFGRPADWRRRRVHRRGSRTSSAN